MSSNDIPNILSGITVVLTLVVIWFAWRTVIEARAATKEEQNVVSQLKAVVQAAEKTAASSASTLDAARQQLSRLTNSLKGQEFGRQFEQLQQAHRLILLIGKTAKAAAATQPERDWPRWRCHEQDELRIALAGEQNSLPAVRALAGANGIGEVIAAAEEADREVENLKRAWFA